jgi:eukaryotic-like serine/threonine-protein kinase
LPRVMASDQVEDEIAVRAQQRIGTVINGKWTIDRLIGVGGMGVVYAATHRNKKRAAVKMLHPELSVDAGIRARFLREGYVANSIEHRGSVRVDDDDVAEDGSAYLVMELLEGESVDARSQRLGGRLPLEEVLSIADQLLDVLVVAHAAGVVHRDLKPENLFLNRDGTLKVLDFGIARLRELGGTSNATRTGSFMGTPAFMAPEQARGRWNEVDGRTDLWAVGAVMFTLLTGRHVHEAETVNEVLALAMTRPAPAIATIMPDVPAPVARVIDQALTYYTKDRYGDAKSMQDAIRAVAKLREVAVAPEASLPAATGAAVAATLLSQPEAATEAQPEVRVSGPAATVAAVSRTSPDSQPKQARKPSTRVVAVGAAAAGLVLEHRSILSPRKQT